MHLVEAVLLLRPVEEEQHTENGFHPTAARAEPISLYLHRPNADGLVLLAIILGRSVSFVWFEQRFAALEGAREEGTHATTERSCLHQHCLIAALVLPPFNSTLNTKDTAF